MRKDQWQDRDDQILTETILNYIQQGRSQVAAFEEVGKRLNRTSAACGYRWNAVLRQSNLEALNKVKQERQKVANKQPKNKPTSNKSDTKAEHIHLNHVINFLESLKEADTIKDYQQVKQEAHYYREQYNDLKKQHTKILKLLNVSE